MTAGTAPFVHEALPGRVVFGVGAVDRVAGEVADLGLEQVLVIAAGSSKPVGELVADQLGARFAALFADVRPHVPEELAMAARTAAAAAGADGIVAVGGGSAIGLAKAIAVDSGVPVVAVPSTYSGSEMTPIYGITGQHKRTARDLRALPRVVVYDPALTVGLPPGVTAASGFNALAHAVEALYAPDTDPVAALHGEEAIRTLAGALPDAVAQPDDLDARGRALYGAYLAGRALAVAGTALHHKLCHVLGGSFGLDHGQANAVVLPYVVGFNTAAAPAVMARLAAALGGPAEPNAAAELLFDLAARLGVPTSLAAIGMPVDGLDDAAARAVAAVGSGNPQPVDTDSLRRLLQAAQEGRRAWRDEM
jgi:alcohol dehydrogenase class IV